MAPSDFANANIDEIMDGLRPDEAISLTAGVGFWNTHSIERLGIPAVKVSDGPNGIRGNHFFMGTPAKCLPSATALGATWDTKLIETVGFKLMAKEAKLRAVSLILAPTVNIQRSPLGGRSFESFSEDPTLSGLIASAYVKGIQSGGIGTTMKHFVGNEKEDDRMGYDSIISPRALREIYLMPFMLAMKHAEPWAIMTAYNRVNGPHVSENPFFLKKILRQEWNFNGVVMSDWFGTYGVDVALNAGLDLEMPGTGKWRTLDFVNRAITARKTTTKDIRARARKVLELVQKCAKGAPEVLDGDGQERTVESEEDRALMRKVAAESIVLLKNEHAILPLKPTGLKKVAIVGGNAKAAVLSGGGSAGLKCSYFVSPYQGILDALSGGKVEVTYCEGARAFKTLPTLEYELVTESGGEPGWMGTWHKHESDESMTPVEEPFEQRLIDETNIFVNTSTPDNITRKWTLRLRGQLKPRPYGVDFEFGLSTAGRAKLFVDGKLVIDNWTRQRRGDTFFGTGSREEKGVYHLKANTAHSIFVEFSNVRGPADGDEDENIHTWPGVRLGGAEVVDADALMENAVELAKGADVVIAIVGLNADWETEGHDRTTLALPGRTDELVAKVVAANPRTIVVVQAGAPVTMPWVDSVHALAHAWYLGNATGSAIADVLFGKHNPSGRLPITFPRREEDVPAFGHFHSENGKINYAEDLFVGYKHYLHRKIAPLFPFGFGLSYTTFSLSHFQISEPIVSDDAFTLTASVRVTNTGNVAGSEVVQLYVSLPPTSGLTHPPLQLKAFAKVYDLQPGQSQDVNMELDKYAVSYWAEEVEGWIVEQGEYGLRAGTSSANLEVQAGFTIAKGFEWRGI